MNLSRSTLLRFLLPVVLFTLGAALCAILVPGEVTAVQDHLVGFPDSDAAAHQLRPYILGALCFFPSIAAFAYSLGGTMDRYLARQFLGIFFIALGALFVVWMLIDLEDNIGEFLESSHTGRTMLAFYSARSSAIILLLLPYALLLSLLYALGKLSASREIVAMVQSGRGLLRITAPLIFTGTLCSLLCLGLNYQWAPTAEGEKDDILNASLGRKMTEARDVLYSNEEDRRLWMVRAFPRNYEKGEPLLGVEVTSSREDGGLESRITAKSAIWNRDNHSWIFQEPVICTYTPGAPPIFETPKEPVTRHGWRETPWQLIKPGLAAAFLGIPDLNSWLHSNAANTVSLNPAPYLTQWHYRIALPFTCLVTVCLAAPLSIHFSRRGSTGGIFLAVLLSALMLLTSSISLVLGEAALIPPFVAAWLPNLLFTLLGLYLFQRRIAGRPIYQRLATLFPGNT